jgi:hypothetical protein
MKIVRLYTGTDEKSRFEEIEIKFAGEQKILTTESRRPAKHRAAAVLRAWPMRHR